MNEITTDPTDETLDSNPQETPQTPAGTTDAPVEGESVPNGLETNSEDPETFPREYVVKLRKESANHRERAKRADDLAHRLHTALVSASGKLADPADLPFNDAHLDSPEALQEAIQTLLTERPHLANRKPMGNIGQGHMSEAPATLSLGGLLRANAN